MDQFSEQFEPKFQIGDLVQVVRVATHSRHYFKRNQMVVNAVDQNTWFECFWTESTQAPPHTSPRFVSFRFHVSLLEAVAPEDIKTGKASTASRE